MVWENISVITVAIVAIIYCLLMAGLYHLTPQKQVMRLRSKAIAWLTVAAIVEALDIFVTIYQMNSNTHIYDDVLGVEKTAELLLAGKLPSFYAVVVLPMVVILAVTIALLLLVLVYGQRYSSQLTLAQNDPILVGGKKNSPKVAVTDADSTKAVADETIENSTIPASLPDFLDEDKPSKPIEPVSFQPPAGRKR